MIARFTKDKHGWRCTHVWKKLTQDSPVENIAPFSILMNVTRAPKLGFCKRPHHYI